MTILNHTFLDKFIISFDQSIRAVVGQVNLAKRKNPAADITENSLSQAEKREIAGLIRVDHTGEICAQALYQGQALVARSNCIKEKLMQAAEEENDHLQWCAERLSELNSHRSYLNPLWYLGAFCIGIAAAACGDGYSLGFIAETERQVEKHLASHLQRLPVQDAKSAAILLQMHADERQHATMAIDAGAEELPALVKFTMTIMAKIMTSIAFWI